VLGYHVIHDAGREINPRLVEGQAHGGVAQGVGMALSEGIVYDAQGQLLTATLMDYGLPRADVLPAIDVEGHDSPSTLNPLGLKGTGEGSAGPPPAAIANAIADALGEDGVEINEIPIARPGLARLVSQSPTP
jgi:aerobic carbon-monoxide dehydrogenase large subunit